MRLLLVSSPSLLPASAGLLAAVVLLAAGSLLAAPVAAQTGDPAAEPVELTSTLEPALAPTSVPVRLAVEADGPCATRLSLHAQRAIGASARLDLTYRSPLLVRLEASDETHFGLSTGRCSFSVLVRWDVLSYQDGDERGRVLLTGVRSRHGQILARRSGRISGGQEAATGATIARFVEQVVAETLAGR